MTITYQSACYSTDLVVSRYVRYQHDGFVFCDVDEKGFTIREGRVEASLVREPHHSKAKALYGYYPSWVIMPLDWRSPC